MFGNPAAGSRPFCLRSTLGVLLLTLTFLGKVQGRTVLSEGQQRYEGHRLYRVEPVTAEQVKTLQDLMLDPPPELQDLDFWNEPSSSLETVDISADSQLAAILESYLLRHGLQYDLVVEDLQSLIEANRVKNSLAKAVWRKSIYDSFLNYDEMTKWLGDAVNRCPFCTLLDLGRSSEGRQLKVIKISTKGMGVDGAIGGRGEGRKPAVWIDAGIHAREWISHSTALFFIDRLISDSTFDADVLDMLEAYDWYILPCVNPDGYHFSHTTNRLWRKTRSKFNDSTSCFGVDANRNFDHHWGSVGTSGSPCTDVYSGPRPFSEPETAAIRDFIQARNGTWKLFLTLHSYGQKILVPYGYTTNKPDNYDNMMAVGEAAKQVLSKVYGTKYSIGSAADILYRSSGTSRDWAAGAAQIPYVYTIELRDTGRHGFLLPASEILPVGAETWEAVQEIVRGISRIEDRGLLLDLDMADLLLAQQER